MEFNMTVQQVPPDATNCFECKEAIYGKMFQYFLSTGAPDDPMPTKFKLCEECYNKE